MFRRKNTPSKARTIALLFVLAVAFTLGSSTMASAHGGNHGTIKVHDDEVTDPGPNNEPHVSCSFWIEGFNMHGSEGDLVFYAWPPTGDKSEIVPTGDTEWSGAANGDGYHFVAGPFELPPGHYRVEAYSDAGHPGGHGHFSKTKTFWVDPCDEPNPCEGLEILLTPNDGGSITIDVTHAQGSMDTRIWRSVSGGPYEVLVDISAPDTQYVDTDTVVGSHYAYAAGPLLKGEAEPCVNAEVTSIPVFPSGIAGALAVAIGSIGYAFVRRRQ